MRKAYSHKHRQAIPRADEPNREAQHMLILKNVKRIIDIRTVTLRDKAKEVFNCTMADISADGQVMIAGPMPPHVLTADEEARFRKALTEDGYVLAGEPAATADQGPELPLNETEAAPEAPAKPSKASK